MSREHVYLMGIGGTGMAALAGLLHESGCRVTGSDGPLYPPTSTLLSGLGLCVHVGYDAAHLDPAPDLVVVGNAISRGNPEIEAVLDRDLEYTSMPRVLHERFLRDRHSVVVAGTHGKTTTTSMLARVLDHAGLQPGFLIGGSPLDFERPYAVGRGGGVFVIEGDEYDTAFFDKGPKFMHYRPDTVLLGSVEFDHADIYADLGAVKTAFRRLTQLVPRRGLIVRHEANAVTREVTGAAPSRVEGYAMEGEAVWTAEQIVQDSGGMTFSVLRHGERFLRARLATGGEHNVLNALAVIAAAHELAVPAEAMAAGLAAFQGVRRRLEVRGIAAGVTVVDDFAHHPTAIDATLRAARARWPQARIWAVLEPRSWSLRRNVFQQELARAFMAADEVLLAAVWGAERLDEGERLDPERLATDIGRCGPPARFIVEPSTIVELLCDEARPGDVVVAMSNGAFAGLHERLLEALALREAASPSTR